MAIQGKASNVIYGKGDICLNLTPFDNFRLFTLYEDWRTDERKPLDLSGGQKMYLIFKSKKKEIRIPEYNGDYTVDKVNGQVLFKITKKNAIDILSMNSNIFYITRVYEVADGIGDNVVSSDEEVLYSGQWKEENSNAIGDYTSQIKKLMSLLEDRNKQIKDLIETNANLLTQIADSTTKISDLQDENEKLSSQVAELEAKVTEYESGTEYAGEVIDDSAQHVIISQAGGGYTEEQWKSALSNLEETIQK